MTNTQKSYTLPITMMFALFFMIAFVTGLQNPMGVIVKNQFQSSNFLAQLGNFANFIAYAFMGIPAGLMLQKIGYKKTALSAVFVGFLGVGITFLAGNMGSFPVYLLGAFISGFSMCMLNTVVNPMLNVLGGGGNSGNQLIQLGGVFNSSAAVACYILMGALIADVSKARISDASPALLIAFAIFAIAFVVILFTKIEEPVKEEKESSALTTGQLIAGALGFRHFALGALAIFLYMGIEVGVPNFVQQDLVAQGIPVSTVGLLVAVYWFMMLIGRFVGASIGSKVSSRAMITAVSTATLVLVLFGMYAPSDVLVSFPGVNWSTLELIWQPIPLGTFSLLLVGLCTSVMWGAIFNLAVEGLGRFTAIASGIFMTMVFGCAVMMAVQGYVADLFGYNASFWVVVFCAAYILFYALVGSRVSRRDEA